MTVRPAVHSVLGDDSPRARRSDPDTTHEAADSNDVSKSRGAVLEALREHGPNCDWRLHKLLSGLGYNYSAERVRTARKELQDAGLVIFADDYDRTPMGRRTRVWAAT